VAISIGSRRFSDVLERLNDAHKLTSTLRHAGFIAPMRPDKYFRIAAAARREYMAPTYAFAAAARRCPARPALVDERGTLTWRELDERCDALAVALQGLSRGQPRTVGIMCRNHRGFVEALVAANRIGTDLLLLNTSFAGPALAEVVDREGVDTVIHDAEFTDSVDRALADKPDATRIVANGAAGVDSLTVEGLITHHSRQRPERPAKKSKTVLLTSGTTGIPKGAKLTSGDANALKAILDRTPWRAEDAVMIAAPMFHAWGYGQLLFAALMACTIVTQRKFDPEKTLKSIDEHACSGLVVVPVMFDRIMDLPEDVLNRYSCRSLRFATASGSRMHPDAVVAFMDRFGDVIVNNYNATEAGMIASATPEDLRAAPETAGKPVPGTELRILDDDRRQLPINQIGQIFVRSGTLFEGYSSGGTKRFHDGFMASGDMGYLDANGRLFVAGRDDEMIVSGGENVYPIEVEKILARHPDVADVAVIGVDDEQYGQRLAAFVVFRSDASATPETLKQHVRESLANYKVPRDIIVLDEIPRNPTGKVLRGSLRGLSGDG
jgi:acyl-CoA synthetase (AMP-forming)/AMP-acid ligase II